MAEKVEKDDPQQERARRLEESLKKGPRPPQTPHEFVQEQMRKDQQKKHE